ncbi:AI-2E family transporter [Neotabrizicola shimadae]|uniref:AI-2E family transporter n=1 Tax=Neotabrizicola shimadae TaxID=2807096 RepID=A0A8G0ZYK0_9RHOB|nr:AI-2E family transporter [Neotabrizicola shimadae]QYZ71265.1 AI-2E family transporter [Neotabrizicola shimadae]
MSDDRTTPAAALFYALGSAVLVTLILSVGRSILMPLAFAVVAVFILGTLADRMARTPGLGRLPAWVRHTLLLAVFLLFIALIFFQIRLAVVQVAANLPLWTANYQALLADLDARLGIEEMTGADLSGLLAGYLDVRALAMATLGAAGSLGGMLIGVALYTGFLMVERDSLVKRVHLAFQSRPGLDRALTLGAEANERIGGYLVVKTAINIMLGILCYVPLKLMGVEMAGFWAIVTGMVNYIPYLGTWVAIILPILAFIGQGAGLPEVLTLAVALIALQAVIGNIVDPRLTGQKVNLSPLVVLIGLVYWTMVWGLPGAVLAVPLTSIVLVVLALFPGGRPIAVLLSNTGEV